MKELHFYEVHCFEGATDSAVITADTLTDAIRYLLDYFDEYHRSLVVSRADLYISHYVAHVDDDFMYFGSSFDEFLKDAGRSNAEVYDHGWRLIDLDDPSFDDLRVGDPLYLCQRGRLIIW